MNGQAVSGTIEGKSAKIAASRKMKEYSVDENGQVTINDTLTAQTTSAVDSEAGVAFTVAVTDRKAVLSRPDNGFIEKVAPGKYEAHTLYSWTGNDTEEGFVYTQPTSDGSPGDTWAELKGVASGSWSTKEYTQYNPIKVGDDILVKWSGSSEGEVTYDPPIQGWQDPVHVRTTTYDGKAPNATWGGSSQGTETWKYSVKDKQDEGMVELECKWFYHYAHENWRNAVTGPPVIGQKLVLFTANLGPQNTSYSSPPLYDYTLVATTYYVLNPFVSPGFTVHRNHIGIPTVRNAVGHSATLEYNNPTGITIDYQAPKIGTYVVWLRAKAMSTKANIDVWNSFGTKTETFAYFAPSEDFECDIRVQAPGEPE